MAETRNMGSVEINLRLVYTIEWDFGGGRDSEDKVK